MGSEYHRKGQNESTCHHTPVTKMDRKQVCHESLLYQKVQYQFSNYAVQISLFVCKWAKLASNTPMCQIKTPSPQWINGLRLDASRNYWTPTTGAKHRPWQAEKLHKSKRVMKGRRHKIVHKHHSKNNNTFLDYQSKWKRELKYKERKRKQEETIYYPRHEWKTSYKARWTR